MSPNIEKDSPTAQNHAGLYCTFECATLKYRLQTTII